MKPIYYQSANLTDDESIKQFVVRLKDFNKVISEIRADDMKGSIQHYIFVGQRGSGKSTLLRRIEASISTENELQTRLIAVNLSEEQAGIYRLHDLWDRVIQELELRKLVVESVDWKEYGTNYTEYAKALYLAIQKALKKEGRKLVLLLDNIDRIFKNIGEEAKLLREILSNHKDVRIIGGSTMLGEHHWDYHKPFFEFFRIVKLDALSHDEIVELLNHWSVCLKQPKLKKFAENHPGRLDALRILTDGMPRTMYNFVELLLGKNEHNSYDYLRHIVDRATPVYQERLEVLSPQQRKVVLELSFFWDAVKVAELSDATKIPSKSLSAVLNNLEDAKIVEKRKGTGKDKLYLLRERFFNFWLIMTQGGPQQKSEAKALTIFLETWYDSVEFKKLYKQFQKEIDGGNMNPDKAIINAKAFVHSKYLTWKERDSLIDSTIKSIGDNIDFVNLLPKKAEEIYQEVLSLMRADKYEQAIQKCSRIEQDDDLRKIILGLLYYGKPDLAKAEESFKSAINSDEEPSEIVYQHLVKILTEQGKWDAAEELSVEAAEHGFKIDFFVLGQIHRHAGRLDDALKNYEQVVDKDTINYCVELAFVLASLSKYTEAIKWYEKAVKLGHSPGILHIALVLYYTNENPKRAYQLIQDFKKAHQSFLIEEGQKLIVSRYEIEVGLWSGDFEVLDGLPKVVDRMSKASFDGLSEMLIFILIHKQTETVWGLFSSEIHDSNLKQLLRPVYYATAHLLGLKDIVSKQPPELEETIISILDKVRERSEFYYGKNKASESPR